jgi:hypothetical protein
VRGDYTRTLALTRLLLLLAPLRAFVAPAFVAGRDLVFFFSLSHPSRRAGLGFKKHLKSLVRGFNDKSSSQ